MTGMSGNEPAYVISVAAQLLGMHVQTLRYYERAGILQPSRSQGNIRLYSQHDLQRVQEVRGLMEDLGVNLAGAEVILRMREHLRQLERERDLLRAENARLKDRLTVINDTMRRGEELRQHLRGRQGG